MRAAIIPPTTGAETGFVFEQGEVDVVGHEQIDVAVPVVVQECCAGAPAILRRDHRIRDIGERAVAIVAVQRVGAEVRDVQVQIAVVVVVTHGQAHAVAAVAEARFIGHVHEPLGHDAVRPNLQIVAVQTIATFGSLQSIRVDAIGVRQCAERERLHGIHIQVAIAVVIKQPAPGARNLREVILTGSAGGVNEVQAGDLGDINEPDLAGIRRTAWIRGRGLLIRTGWTGAVVQLTTANSDEGEHPACD